MKQNSYLYVVVQQIILLLLFFKYIFQIFYENIVFMVEKINFI